jgi:undecaprenyl-diphosphatase
LSWWQALVLGIVEGLTEYLPVSSTGHLLLTQRIMGIGAESAEAQRAADAYAICIQAGAILAVLGLYRARVQSMTRGLLGQDPPGRRMALQLLTAFAPAAIVGPVLDDYLELYLFNVPSIATAWLVGGVAILLAAGRYERSARSEESASLELMTYRMALLIGIAQCAAMWPGVSRSLMTILAGIAVGLSVSAAVEFSFLLGLITLTAATAFKAVKDGDALVGHYGPLEIVIGLVAAWASAVLAVTWMVGYLKRHSIAIFGYYRIALAAAVFAALLAGVRVQSQTEPISGVSPSAGDAAGGGSSAAAAASPRPG